VVIGANPGIFQLYQQAHTKIGTIVVCLMVVQPALGFAHHSYYKKHKERGSISYVHIYYGRALMLLGVINGGLGLQLAAAPQAFITAYIVVAAVIAALYVIVKFVSGLRRRRAQKSQFTNTQYQSVETREANDA
jgi:hypothetical protein